MFYKKSKIIVITCCFLFCIEIGDARVSDSKILENVKELEKMISCGMKEFQIPGIACCISRKGKTVYKACFGVVSHEDTEKIDNNTIFPIASLTKNLTGVLICALVDDKKIKFEDKVGKYLPDFFLSNEHITKNITILDLVSMTSGCSSYAMEMFWYAGYSKDKILKSLRFARQKFGSFQKEYAYQNIIFGILGEIIEKATGERYEDVLQRYILDKMNMENASAIPLKCSKSFFSYAKYRISRFGSDCKMYGFSKAIQMFFTSLWQYKSKKVVKSNALVLGKIQTLPFTDIFQTLPATAGINLSLNDLAKWAEVLAGQGDWHGKQIISPENFHKMTQPIGKICNLKDDNNWFPLERMNRENIAFGIGAFNVLYGDEQKNWRMLISWGGVYGITSGVFCAIDEDISIGILCNFGGTANTMFMSKIAFQFFDLCLGLPSIDWIQKEKDQNKETKKNNNNFEKYLSSTNLAASDVLKNYVGVFSHEICNFVISVENNDLILNNDIRKVKLKHVNQDIFEFYDKDFCENFLDNKDYVFFHRDEQNKIYSLSISCFDHDKLNFVRQ